MKPLSARNTRRRFLQGVVLTSGAAASVTSVARAAPIEFKAGTNHGLEEPQTRNMIQMWAAIQHESGGRLAPQFFPNGQLGGDAATFSQLRVGAVQFLLMSPAVLSAVVPATNISYLGFAFRDVDELFRVMDGRLGAYLAGEIAAKGLHAFPRLWDAGMFQIGSSTRPITAPDDMHGFKIRVSGGQITVDLFKQLGAIPTPLSFNEVYTALQTKLVDGEAAPLSTIEAAKFYEINKYVSLTNHGWAGDWLIANNDFWKSLAPDLQGIIERNAVKYALQERRDTKTLNASLATQLGRQGMAINPVNGAPFRTALASYFGYWANEFGPTAWGLLESSLGRRIT